MHEYRTAAPGPNLTLLLCSQVNRGSNHTILQQKNGNLEICPSKTQCAGVSAGQRGAFLEWQPTIYTHLHTRTHTHTHTHTELSLCVCVHTRGKQGLQRALKQHCVTEQQPPIHAHFHTHLHTQTWACMLVCTREASKACSVHPNSVASRNDSRQNDKQLLRAAPAPRTRPSLSTWLTPSISAQQVTAGLFPYYLFLLYPLILMQSHYSYAVPFSHAPQGKPPYQLACCVPAACTHPHMHTGAQHKHQAYRSAISARLTLYHLTAALRFCCTLVASFGWAPTDGCMSPLTTECPGLVLQQECPGLILQQECHALVFQQECPGLILQHECPGLVLQQECPGLVLQQSCELQE